MLGVAVPLTKLTLTVDKTALAAAMRYSKQRGTSLSRMVDQLKYLRVWCSTRTI